MMCLRIFAVTLLCYLAAPHQVEGASHKGAKIMALSLEVKPLGMKYCAGDDEVGTVHIESHLRLRNAGQGPLILYKGSGTVLEVMAASTPEDLSAKKLQLSSSVTTVYTTLEVKLSLGPRPGSTFVILPTGDFLQAGKTIVVPVKRTVTKLAGLTPGTYFVQVSVETWPESQDLGRLLHERWKRWGNLWLEPSITSEPIPVTIDRNPKFETCE